ncbi:TLC domain-containing protein [Dunaliella salina]|uniref:TLC domain-containing protein n=1 Tax=Dunaliella salina TaxID=3046 RepID=A0ABQ7GAI0_DUNSA|nr:TLC domain-containing protein [Dunaliella salina]|eukprot:KAF5831612.1 TLC domain-containing protein [Dunaliella salina]
MALETRFGDHIRHYVMALLPRHEVEIDVLDKPEPEQVFLLGNRWNDYGLAFFFALALPVLRSILRATVYEPTANRIYARHKLKMTDKERAEWLRKFNESSWKLTIFVTFTVTAFLVSYGETWFHDTRFSWLGRNHFPPCNLTVSKGVRRKDWLESMIHHIATSFLLVYSYYVNFTRIGVMTLFIHDMSDIFLEAAKLCRCAQQEGIGVIMFLIFVPTWIITRNIYFPMVIIRSTLTESLKYAAIHGIAVEPHYSIFNGLLLLLMILHIYWTYLILKIIYRKLFSGKLDDIREQDVHDD